MWSEQVDAQDGTVIKLALLKDGAPASFQQVLLAWKNDRDFCRFFNRVLAAMPFEAFFWEMPPLQSSTVQQRFECAVVDSPQLAKLSAEPEAFHSHFAAAEDGIVTFDNLGGDALLIAPVALADEAAYPHIAAFCRYAPREQQLALWQRLGEYGSECVADTPLWLNTSGLGVPWLHLRLDRYPKYYTYLPYKTAAGSL